MKNIKLLKNIRYYGLIGAMVLTTLSGCTKKSDDTKKVIKEITSVPNKIEKNDPKVEITESETLESVLLNNNLDLDIKKRLLNKFNIIYDNIDYINVDELKDNLTNLKFKTHDSSEYYYEINGNVVDIYGYKTVLQLFDYDYTAINEILVSMSMKKNNGLGTNIQSALKEIIVDEYSGNKDTLLVGNYINEKKAIYPLIELLGTDIIRDFFFTGDVNVLIESLNSIIPNMKNATDLVNQIDNVNLTINNYFEINDDFQIANAIAYNKFNELLSYYYEKKYEWKLNDEPIMNFYMSRQYNSGEYIYMAYEKFENAHEDISNDIEIHECYCEPPIYFNNANIKNNAVVYVSFYDEKTDQSDTVEVSVEREKAKIIQK